MNLVVKPTAVVSSVHLEFKGKNKGDESSEVLSLNLSTSSFAIISKLFGIIGSSGNA